MYHHVVDDASDEKHVTKSLDKMAAAKKAGAYTVGIATGAAMVASVANAD